MDNVKPDRARITALDAPEIMDFEAQSSVEEYCSDS
jgi:hypothetical protein